MKALYIKKRITNIQKFQMKTYYKKHSSSWMPGSKGRKEEFKINTK